MGYLFTSYQWLHTCNNGNDLFEAKEEERNGEKRVHDSVEPSFRHWLKQETTVQQERTYIGMFILFSNKQQSHYNLHVNVVLLYATRGYLNSS